ncbi:hypothetical protein ACFGVS_20355 [Mucilaginibacter sp. AW1-7]|uniref:hypothetical protein n=1 Tax=Mucilaginibacter sp. AW1-7 TaxID=3349874 RepID=UPI003F735F99
MLTAITQACRNANAHLAVESVGGIVCMLNKVKAGCNMQGSGLCGMVSYRFNNDGLSAPGAVYQKRKLNPTDAVIRPQHAGGVIGYNAFVICCTGCRAHRTSVAPDFWIL